MFSETKSYYSCIKYKLIYNQIEHYNLETQYYHSVKIFWPVQNNQTVIDAISEINSRNKTFSISTLDLSTLYTNTPHHNLKSVMGEFDFYFNGGDKKFIGITKYSATWTNNQQI